MRLANFHLKSCLQSRYLRSPRVQTRRIPPSNLQTQPPEAQSPRDQPGSLWQRKKDIIVSVAILVIFGSVYAFSQWARKQAMEKENLRPLIFLRQNFETSLSNLYNGRLWTLLTSSFTHYSLLHLAVNTMAILSFAPLTLMRFGTGTFVFVWVGGAITSWVFQSTKNQFSSFRGAPQDQASIGASGVALAFFSIAAHISPQSQVIFFPFPFGVPIGLSWYGIGAITLAFLFSGAMPEIGHAGHLGGMAFGSFTVLLLRKLGRLR